MACIREAGRKADAISAAPLWAPSADIYMSKQALIKVNRKIKRVALKCLLLKTETEIFFACRVNEINV